MKKLVKRWIAGVSAAALLVSAVGFDAFTNMFMRTASAEETGKNGRSTGFPYLEQDTDGDDYNTGYGLHTNKTATEAADVKDGRTFDVDLESWYVGENPVDVATILDASGSMAWTVDTLKPLLINDEKMIVAYLGFNDTKDADLNRDDKVDINDLIMYQEEHGGYLPQDVVDKILLPSNTDNSKLGYDKYQYYIYDNRSTVDEFVPLGYWDGTRAAELLPKDNSLIGYYPFEGTLENQAAKAADGATATYIKHAEDNGGVFSETAVPMVTIEPSYVKKADTTLDATLDLKATAENGALMLDIDCPDTFTMAMRISSPDGEAGQARDKFEEIPFLYIGDLNGNNYIKIVRSSSDARNIKVYNGTNVIINYTGVSEKRAFHDKDWVNVCVSYDGNEIKIMEYDKNQSTPISTMSATLTDFPTENAKIIIGGDIDGHTGDYSEMQLTELCVFKIALNDDQLKTVNTSTNIKSYSKMESIGESGNLVGYYDFGDDDNDKDNKYDRLDNIASTTGGSLTFIEQAEGKTFSGKEIKSGVADPVYSNDSNSGSQSLNVSQTAKLGSVLLDVHPKNKSYTLTFAIKKNEDTENDNGKYSNNAEIMYIGSSNLSDNDYYNMKRTCKANGDDRHLRFYKETHSIANINDVFQNKNESISWSYITYVFEDGKLRVYRDGEKAPSSSGGLIEKLDCAALTTETINFIIAGLKDEYDGSDILLDDLYVFDKALTAEEVELYFAGGKCDVADRAHAYTIKTNGDGTQEFSALAQISDGNNRLVQNEHEDERRGWYYVNSHSAWNDISGCLESGKQYIGIYDKDGIKNVDAVGRDIATVPSGADADLITSITNGNTNTEEDTGDDRKLHSPPDRERSIRFYVDKEGHLRCFAWSGNTSKKDDPTTSENEEALYTFCSLVYEKGVNAKGENEITKYEDLNSALNVFYQGIAEKSDLSNNAVVRFSTNKLMEEKDDVNDNLKTLIMKDWTNWSGEYIESGRTLAKDKYLYNLLIPEEEESSVPSDGSTEYPYVMTGGTYTWTGLKSFYDNMVKNEENQMAKDIANDARDKYLIIFTDGRDNTQDYDVVQSEIDYSNNELDNGTAKDKQAGSPNYATGKEFMKTDYVDDYNPYAGEEHKVGFSITNYYYCDWKKEADERTEPQRFTTTGGHKIEHDGDLAEAWADKLKDEGYTIYCVMLATGSISPTANVAEYNKAKNFLKSLSGGKDVDEEIADLEKELSELENKVADGDKPEDMYRKQAEIENLRDNYVIVVDPNQKDDTTTGTNSLDAAFKQILEDIQQPRDDYTVQDYIDPRFDLVDKDGNLYQLGAGGKITVTDTKGNDVTGLRLSDGSAFVNGSAVGNIIDSIDKNEAAAGLAYTPRKSENMIDTDTGYIYYDDVKDMYYLRWDEQQIPMENEVFDTIDEYGNLIKDESGNAHYLDVWSATIRLQAKSDFIGGNNILTNGNEAGENLVYSNATIENMDKDENYTLYGFEEEDKDPTLGKIPYRKKLEALSGTDRKINAVDAGGVSQAVYGNGIDIPSSGFPRTTVNVRLLQLDANNLNDVIYMGEVVSPTMMLADLEDGYMTGSYYLQYLERYAYRVYGEGADETPLIELLNKWLKIDDKKEASKTFTIPYIYLPDPKYKDGKLDKGSGTNVIIENSTGWDSDKQGEMPAFDDLNLQDVTGFITYTWKRDDGGEEQQKTGDVDSSGKPEYDVTRDYVVKNTNQIVYNLQLTFTPLKETKAGLDGFTLDGNFIKANSDGTGGDKFFNIDSDEFNDEDVTEWTTAFGREDYLKAMVKEERTYTPHVMYNAAAVDGGKWKLIEEGDKVTALSKYAEDGQTTDNRNGTLTDKGVYDWDNDYKPDAGNPQIEEDQSYTSTPDNVNISVDGFSLEANTTYTKDVVNGALALELVVDGRYLKGTNPEIDDDKTFTFDAIRYYDDPLDPLPYDTDTIMKADTGVEDATTGEVEGLNYRLTFTVDKTTLPTEPKDNQLYTVWATLSKVQVKNGSSDYQDINTQPLKADEKTYIGYKVINALPIGTYEIKVKTSEMTNTTISPNQFYLGNDETGKPVHFKYLKLDQNSDSYKYNRFPEEVYTVSEEAVDVDPEYLIKNGSTDNAPENIADSNRNKPDDTQTLTFYLGTVEEREIDGTLYNTKGYSKDENPDEDYIKDRLGIMLLSTDNNALTISKEVTNTNKETEHYKRDYDWEFTITLTSDDTDWASKATAKWYKLDKDGNWKLKTATDSDRYLETITFSKSTITNKYEAKIKLMHDEKVVITDLPEGTWQVTEEDAKLLDTVYTPHNNANGEANWLYKKSEKTTEHNLQPNSSVDFVNEFPYELPSTGDIGTDYYIFFGTMLTIASVLFVAWLWYDRRKRRAMHE